MSRRSILRALRRGEGGPRTVPGASASPLPGAEGPWQRFDDPKAHFEVMLAAAGGTCGRASGADAVAAFVEARVREFQARRIWIDAATGLDGVPSGASGVVRFDDAAVADTAAAAALELAVLAGAFAVAENGAVWVEASGWPHPGIHVLPEHLVLVVPGDACVPTLHEAYERIDLRAPGFGVFLAGPSKTADIEQALVIGAHGARSLAVVWSEGVD